MNLLMDMTLREFDQLLASKAPAPGGGSTAALAGMLGASLTMMVYNLTIGKKAWEALEGGVRQQINDDFAMISALKEELTILVDEDTVAFTCFMKAMQLPKATDAEQSYRHEQMQHASRFALDVPLRVADKCLQILRHQREIALYGNKNAISDIGVGAELAATGLKSAALNVQINLPGIEDREITADAIHKIDRISREGELLRKEIMEIVERRIG